MDRDSLRELHFRGHEIGLHGHAHRAASAFSAQDFRDDLQKNRDWLESIDEGIRPANFAYPYGLASFARKRQLYGLVASSRSIAPGVIAGEFDPQFLRCVELADQRLTPERLAAYLDLAVQSSGWLIFCSHDIADAPTSYGCTHRTVPARAGRRGVARRRNRHHRRRARAQQAGEKADRFRQAGQGERNFRSARVGVGGRSAVPDGTNRSNLFGASVSGSEARGRSHA